MPYAAVDVHYPPDGGGRAALVLADSAAFAAPYRERVCFLDTVAPYRPGEFYLRELPALTAVLAGAGPLELLVVDGYVDLDPDGRPGLGAHAYDQGLAPVVIGVAKTAFRCASHAVPVRRGVSSRPLYVTSVGLPVAEAAGLVAGMAGDARLPTALHRVDRLARGAPPG
jgi:deoxyribonuclease V